MSFKIIDQAKPRLNRSELAVPGSNPSLFEKAAKSNVDVIFLDLEDAVAPDEKEQARKNFELEAEYTRTRLKMNVIKCAMIQGKTSLDDAIVYDPDDEEWEKMIVFSKHPFYDWIIGEKPLMDGFEEGFTRDLENYKKIRAKIDPKTGKFPRND